MSREAQTRAAQSRPPRHLSCVRRLLLRATVFNHRATEARGRGVR